MALELPKFAKKEKKDNISSPRNDVLLKIMEFFDKNPLMKILVPVLLFVIIAAIILFIVFGDGVLTGDVSEEEIANSSNIVQALPGDDIITDKEIIDLIDNDPLSPDILTSAKYKGFVQGSNGGVNALIEIGSEGDNLQVERGETIGESSWELIEVNKEYVIFKANDEQKKITRQ